MGSTHTRCARRSDTIYVKFYDDTKDTWRYEDPANKIRSYGEDAGWPNEDLENSGGHRLTRWRVFYSYREADGDWSDTVWQEVSFRSRWSDHACTDDSWYTDLDVR